MAGDARAAAAGVGSDAGGGAGRGGDACREIGKRAITRLLLDSLDYISPKYL